MAVELAYSSENYLITNIVTFDEVEFDNIRQCILNYNKATIVDSFLRKTNNGNDEYIYIAQYKKNSLFEISKYENEILINNKITINDFFKNVESLVYNYPKLFLIIAIEYDKINSKFIINNFSLTHEYFSYFKIYNKNLILNDHTILNDICKNRHLIIHILSLNIFNNIVYKYTALP